MKGLYTLLFVILIQTCLNASESVINIPEDSRLEVAGCTADSKNYGFGFEAYTSGFGKDSKLYFYCSDSNYNYFECDIPESKEGEKQTISCWSDTSIFPLLDQQNKVILPESLSFPDFKIEGWENLKRELTFGFCSQVIPTNTFTVNGDFSLSCDNSHNNVVSTTGLFEDNLQDKKVFLTSSEEESTTYYFEPPLVVDSNIARANCKVFVYNQNASTDKLECVIDGKEVAKFFDTAVPLKILEGTEELIIRMKPSNAFKLQLCDTTSKSSFIKLSSLLLISLFLL